VPNPAANRTSLTDKRGAQNFGYDNLDRLTSADHPLLATPQAFAYDPVGNRTTNSSLYNVGNQLTEDANFTYLYDANGNLIQKTFKTSGKDIAYTYDAENRLIQVDEFAFGSSTPGAMSTYRYDGLGRRIEKIGNGITRRYVYDGEDILLEYDGANVLQARYTHGPGIDEPIAMTRDSSTYFYHQDGLGTVTELTDSSGATAQSYAYDAYGNIVQQTGTVENPYTYTGRELDSETGLYYYRARYYDPRTGRFLQKDPIGLAGGDTNLYGYVRNNPINLVDPMGKEAGTLVLGGAALGATTLSAPVIATLALGGAIAGSAICYAVPECRQWVSCFRKYLSDLLDCAKKGYCQRGDLIFNDTVFNECAQDAWGKFRRCRGFKDDSGPGDGPDGGKVLDFPAKRPKIPAPPIGLDKAA
jgi:RHS repeat-associated protein